MAQASAVPLSPLPLGSYSTREVQDLHLLTTRKDRRVAQGIKHLSMLNASAVLVIVALVQWVVSNGMAADFRNHALQALAAFLAGAIVASFVYGMRTSAVVLRLTGPTRRFRITAPVIFAMIVGICGFLAGLLFAYEGLVGTLDALRLQS